MDPRRLPHPGGGVDAADLLADEAWPALRAVLHQVDDAGADPVAVLQARAAERAFGSDRHDPARSAAKVLHYRIVADLPYPHPGAGRPELLPGWVATPPAPSSDTEDAEYAELGEWLRQRATRIADRVRDLGERAAHTPPVWAAALGEVPDDPLVHDTWIRRAGHIGAYRERWRIPDTTQLLPPHDYGEQGRARAWVWNCLHQHPIPQQPTSPDAQNLGARTTRVRERLDALRARLARQPADRADAGLGAVRADPALHDPGPDAEQEPDHDIGL